MQHLTDFRHADICCDIKCKLNSIKRVCPPSLEAHCTCAPLGQPGDLAHAGTYTIPIGTALA